MRKELGIGVLLALLVTCCYAEDAPMYDVSRNNCVRILTDEKSVGSGFFLDEYHVATCFHVAAKEWTLKIEPNEVTELQWTPQDNIQVEMDDGAIVSATFLSDVGCALHTDPIIQRIELIRHEGVSAFVWTERV